MQVTLSADLVSSGDGGEQCLLLKAPGNQSSLASGLVLLKAVCVCMRVHHMWAHGGHDNKQDVLKKRQGKQGAILISLIVRHLRP